MNSGDDLKARLLSALDSEKPGNAVGKLIHDFEDSLLGRKSMSDAHFDFVVFFIQTAPALRLECAAHLFMALHIEFYLLSQEQVRRLVDVVRAVKFVSQGSEMAAFACADMFARNLDPLEAARLFEEAQEGGAHVFSISGADVLRIRSLRST